MARTDPSKRTCPTCNAKQNDPCRATALDFGHPLNDLLLGYHEARVAPSRETLKRYA